VGVYVLGQLTVECDSGLLRQRDLPGNQARVALAMLAVEHRHPISRDQIADELWPDQLPVSWQTALRAIISKVRSSLANAGINPPSIGNAFGCYQLQLNGGWLDLDAAADALHDAEADLRSGNAMGAAANATVTCILCSRPFLPGAYGPWTVRQRERINDLHLQARECLADARAALGDFKRSAQAAEIALTLRPLPRRGLSATDPLARARRRPPRRSRCIRPLPQARRDRTRDRADRRDPRGLPRGDQRDRRPQGLTASRPASGENPIPAPLQFCCRNRTATVT
jgi:hypothetical protein